MSRVLVIGCGGVASVAIQKCCQVDEVFTEMCIASRTKEKCDALVEKLKGKTKTVLTTAKVDADDVDQLIELINSYKPDLVMNIALPSPVKKRYSKEHLLVLIFIYYFKNILSINDIQTLLNPITDKYFKSQEKLDLTSIYEEVFSMEKEQIEVLKKELLKNYQTAQNTFTDAPEDEQDFLKLFSFICLLSFDVYMKKTIIEQMIDSLRENDPKKKK